MCHLTLYKGRRDDEHSRLLKTQWQDAMANVWFPSEMVEQVEDAGQIYLIDQIKVAYFLEKAKKDVLVLILTNVIDATEIIIQHCTAHGINDSFAQHTALMTASHSVRH